MTDRRWQKRQGSKKSKSGLAHAQTAYSEGSLMFTPSSTSETNSPLSNAVAKVAFFHIPQKNPFNTKRGRKHSPGTDQGKNKDGTKKTKTAGNESSPSSTGLTRCSFTPGCTAWPNVPIDKCWNKSMKIYPEKQIANATGMATGMSI